ncbi:hypothetical protein STCU_10283 [Strigomonas culicis]|uniref:Uncharacterized protein n=1 Tax=Strigomonas culicis TaxID=28005 RepID=S9TMF7_9TRYP|nr:hypothetical protein STCU_10283 [Strigomonas culicis]|eukprot:EPY17964.1 hypothetical protein STCU_10283 [Strigomonas culicis]
MYFKNKEVGRNEVEYKKEGEATAAVQCDSTMDHPIRTLLFLDTQACPPDEGPVEVDGATLRVDGSVLGGAEAATQEVVKIDLTRIHQVHLQTDAASLESEHMEDVRMYFENGCNVALLLADSDGSAARPSTWASWQVLRRMLKNVFANKRSTAEISLSVALLQEDGACDLLLDADDRFHHAMRPLVVAESPMFGKVVSGMVYMGVDDATEFNDTLDDALRSAEDYYEEYPALAGDEYGIVQITVLYKQIRVSPSTDKVDVVVSSLFASGVGDGVIHYSRILDKNPAEPRALFQFVLYRSVHCNAIFTLRLPAELMTLAADGGGGGGSTAQFLQLLRRLRRMSTRRPNVRSAIGFVKSASAGIANMEADIKEMGDGKKKAFMLRQLEKQKTMLADTEALLANPREEVPKTYV